MALAVDVVVLLGVGADVVSGLALADAVNVVAVGGGVLLAVAAEVVDAGASGGGIGWGGTGSGCWPQSGSYVPYPLGMGITLIHCQTLHSFFGLIDHLPKV